MAAFDFSSSFAGLNSALGDLGKAVQNRRDTEALLAAFDQSQGLSPAAAAVPSIGGLGSAVAPSATAEPNMQPVAGPASLIKNESGGRWNAQNDAEGAGGMKGHFGRLQFGQARLQEAMAAGAIPAGTTVQAFMASPEIQQAAERWHFNDIDQSIRQNGFERLLGSSIGGVPVTVDGMRAVAHLGGKEGLRKFIETGGQYNPSDENGTRLSDYFARHGGAGGARVQTASAGNQPLAGGGGAYAQSSVEQLQGFLASPSVPDNLKTMMRQELASRGISTDGGPVQVADGSADMPAPGAREAQGFVIPQGAAPATSRNVSGQTIRSLLANPGTRDIGKQLWAQTLSGKQFGFMAGPDGVIYRTNPATGAAEPVTPPKREAPTTVGEGQALVGPDGRLIYERPRAPSTISEGQTLVGPYGKVIYSQPKPQLPQKVGEGEALVGPDGTQLYKNSAGVKPEAVTGLRKEIQSLPSYKNLSQAAPIYRSMFEAAGRNSKASDLNLVYGLGKIMDPGSVVREGEMVMVKNSAGLPDWLVGAINSLNGGAALSPATRQAVMQEAYGRLGAYRDQFEVDASSYRDIAGRQNMDIRDVMPSFGEFQPWQPPRPAAPPPGAAPSPVPPAPAQEPDNRYVRPDGSSPPTPSAPPAENKGLRRIPKNADPAEVMRRLPSGTEFLDPNGVRRRVP